VSYRSINPSTGEVLKTFAEHTADQMMHALVTAAEAFRRWAAQPFRECSKIIGRSSQNRPPFRVELISTAGSDSL
jgi:succinate-semialdehyde dehydrogenase/glutarate-semialdehyde dehydrogenase